MTLLSPSEVHAVASYGYGAVAIAVGIESIGVPFPGETTLIAAAIYAGATHHLSIAIVVAAAAFGAIVGDNVGFWLGREFGFRLLVRFGPCIRITPRRIKLGQYLFERYGGAVVFFGRFVAVLRSLAAPLAGAHQMTWPRFLLFNAAGGAVWAAVYGFGAYYFGKEIHRLVGLSGLALAVTAFVLIVAGFVFLRRNEKSLEAEAERAIPGEIGAGKCGTTPIKSEQCIRRKAKSMPHYRAYLVGTDRDIKLAWDIVGGTDGEAMAEAGHLILAHAGEIPDDCLTVEVWEGTRYVSRLRISERPPH